MTEKENCEVLFEYLKSILYDNNSEQPDISSMVDEPYRRLGRGLQFLHQAVREMQSYAADLSRGNLSGELPSRDNFLCSNLKNLHANLNHLTWQAKQIAAGDYSQNVSYLGEFADAFNTMTVQLTERESQLKEQAEKETRRAEQFESYNRLMTEIMDKRNELMVVVDAQNGDLLYSNRRRQSDAMGEDLLRLKEILGSFDGKRFQQSHDHAGQSIWKWEEKCHGQYYRGMSLLTEWHEKLAYVHMIENITQERLKVQTLTSIVYRDPGTGVYNRRYFEEHMHQILEEQLDVTLCYLDMDGLKYVNDHYGHNEGDSYIKNFVSQIQQTFRSNDVLTRIGGDEFCMFLPGCKKEVALEKLEKALMVFVESNKKAYPVSFSYGVVEIGEQMRDQPLEEILSLADQEMYKCKSRNRIRFPRP